MSDSPSEPTGEAENPFIGFVKRNVYVSIIATIAMIGGVIYANVYFDQLSVAEATIAGILFGLVCTAFAVGYRLFEIE